LLCARRGVEIHGLDRSVAMLDILRQKLSREDRELQDRVRVYQGDMKRFSLGRKYPLVILPFRVLQHMYTLNDQVSALMAAKAHTQHGGRLVFDVQYPDIDALMEGLDEEIEETEWNPDDDDEITIRRSFRTDTVDLVRQWFSGVFTFRTYRNDDLIEEEQEVIKMSYYTYPHLRALFRIVGLRVVSEWGSFSRTTLNNDAEHMIFVLE